MANNSSTVSDAAVDLEKGTAAFKEVEKEEEAAIVDPLKTMLANRVMDAVFLLYVLIFTAVVAYVSPFAKNWSELLLTVLALSPLMILCFWMIHHLRKIVLFFVTKRSVGSGNDLNTKLLASDK